MRAADFFVALDGLPLTDLAGLTGGRGLVVVAPHPDDESLGCGGLIAQARAQGLPVRLIVVSDGCGSHPNSRTYPPERLRGLRERETVAAAGELGLAGDGISFLRLPDAHVPRAGAAAEAAADAVAEAARECEAGAVVTTWRHDPHCDHEAAAAIVALARKRLADVRVFEFPVWGWTLSPETEVGAAPTGFRLDVKGQRDAKRKAVAAHASQTTALIADDPDGFRLSEAMIERLCGPYEPFIEIPA